MESARLGVVPGITNQRWRVSYVVGNWFLWVFGAFMGPTDKAAAA